MTVAELLLELNGLYKAGKGSRPVYIREWTHDFGDPNAFYQVTKVTEDTHPNSRRVREIVVIEH